MDREAVSRAASQLAALQAELNATHSELRSGAAELVSAGSAAFESWAAYVDRCRNRIRSLEDRSREARKALTLQTQQMVAAHQKVRVLENLKRDDHADWTRELNRETEAFAGEAFLGKLLREGRAMGMGGRCLRRRRRDESRRGTQECVRHFCAV